MIYQFAYEILDIIMKIWSIITPIMTILFFNMLSRQQHINMQIRYSIDTLCLIGETSLWKFLHTYCIKQNIKSFCYIFYNIVENHH